MRPITYLAIGLFVGVLLNGALSETTLNQTKATSYICMEPNGCTTNAFVTPTGSFPSSVSAGGVYAAQTKNGESKLILVDDDGRVVCAP